MRRIFIILCLLMVWTESALAAGNLGVLWDWQAPGEKESRLVQREKLPGIDVLSPSWFIIENAQGKIKTRHGSVKYVRQAHNKGYQVWALITNNFDPKMTSKLLDSPLARKRVIAQMEKLAKDYELDGFNLDFENINPADKDKLTDFVQEISKALKPQGLIISIDVTIPSNSGYWSKCYDRKAIAEVVDYVMLMAYDEHGAASEVSGSVASLPWVEDGIQKTLQEGVPEKKLILGMPLYMRLWQETKGKVKAKTLSMAQADKVIQEKGLVPVWLSKEGQYYFEYQEKNTRYRVWQENRRSLALKASLVNRYNLAGGAYWRSTLEIE
ncbi:MAG: glycosyl hydrolase family 18 protein, partial [Anaerovibrio sp.]|nr:glycosyl hydrolase family 18 protein [Anaerovibrio sp.]